MKQHYPLSLAAALLIASALGPAAPRARAHMPAPTQAQQITSSIVLRWKGTRGVERYRLQVARDARFRDIIFDSAVVGLEYRVTGLAPGTYYWRIAPADPETGAYSRGTPVVVTADVPTQATATTTSAASNNATASRVSMANVFDASNSAGWRTATGEVTGLVAAQLRAGRGQDFVSINKDGAVHALNGATGVALWTARFRPDARRGEATGSLTPVSFAPVVVADGGASNVVVAFDGGVRSLRGETGREAWRAPLAAGAATGGVAADMNGDGRAEVVVLAGKPSTLYVLDSASGQIVSQARLEGEGVDMPFPFKSGDATLVAVSLTSGVVKVYNMAGEALRTVRLDSQATTAPLVVPTGRGMIMTVGSEKGLDALDANELRPLGRISTESDTVHGRLAAADLDGDGTTEIVLVTKQGRVAVVGTTDGKIRWYAEGASDAKAAAVADLNGDGVLDVVVPAGATFALGFSGRDGSLIWRAEEGGRPLPTGAPPASTRSLTVAAAGEGSYVVGGDPSRTGLRAVEIPKGAAGRAANR